MTKQFITSNKSLLDAGYHLGNAHAFEIPNKGSFLAVIEKNIQAVSYFLFKQKKIDLLKIKESDIAKISNSLQRLYWYLLIQLASNHYKKRIVFDLKHYFDLIGTTRQKKTVDQLLMNLDVLASTFFRYVGVKYEDGKEKIVTATGGLLSYIKVTTPKGYLKKIEIIFGEWLDLAKELENSRSIEIEPDFLRIDSRKYPYAQTYYIKMRERWRYNREDRLKKKRSTETISLKTLLKASGEWNDVHRRSKEHGLTGQRGVLIKIERCLVHLQEYGVKWEWSFLPERTEHLDQVNIIYSMDYDQKESAKV